MRKKTMVFLITCVLAMGLFAASPAKADVSTFWAAWGSDWSTPLRIVNPTCNTMIVAVIVYERDKLVEDSPVTYNWGVVGQYKHCFTFELPPHGATGIEDDLVSSGENGRFYAEIIAVPKDSRRRFGQGILVGASVYGGPATWPVEPYVFSLPQDFEAEQSVINCLCEAAYKYGDPEMWRRFGIMCYGVD